MSRDGWTQVASLLRSEEAELLRGLLESAEIEALVDDAQLSALNPLLQSAVGGAKVLVPAADAARALAIVSESGLFAGTPGEAVEIPEEEWSAPPAPDGTAPPEATPAASAGAEEEGAPGERAAGHALRASFVAFALAWTLVLPLYALVASLRARRSAAATARARTRRGWALAVSALALAVGVGGWLTLFPAIQRLQPEHGAPPPAERAPAPARF